jgi:hypothetical protein
MPLPVPRSVTESLDCSGAVAFEYFNDALGYGLTAATTSNDGAITTNAQFTLLAAAYKAAIPPTSTNAGVAASTYAAYALLSLSPPPSYSSDTSRP